MANKAKVNITGINQTRDQIQKFLQTQIKDQSLLIEIGKETVNQIRNRTRGRLEEYKQPDLKESTKNIRKSLIAQGNGFDDKLAKPNQSNLTLSGQLLDSLYYKFNAAAGFVSIFFLGGRVPYSLKNGKYTENNKSNLDIKNDLESRGRKFFFISERLNSQLQSKIIANLRRKLSLYKALTRK